MDVSIIIVNYKTCKLVLDCIESIYMHVKDVDFEIIVVDNNSEDRSAETIVRLWPQVQVIPLKENIGFGKANNVGVKRACGKYVFFLNSDTVLLNDAVSILADYLDTHDFVGLCGGQLYGRDGELCSSYFKYPNWKYFFSLVFKGNVVFPELPICTEGKIPFYIAGADMMIRKSFIDKYGAFDKDFFMYYEDTELSYRVQKKGLEVHFVPRAKIIHLQDMSPKGRSSKLSVLDLYVIQSRYFYLEKVKGCVAMMLFLSLHIVKSYCAIVYYSIIKKKEKKDNWKRTKKMLCMVAKSCNKKEEI